VDFVMHEARVFVQQEWLYTWTVNPGATAWTIQQKRHFHNTLDRQVWANWSDQIRIRLGGGTALARQFNGRTLRLTFDIRWVLRGGHWSVTVRKLPPGSDPTTFISNVTFGTRQIELDSADLAPYQASNAAGQTRTFRAGPHEFGHTLNNPDEYIAGSPHLPDTSSILNIGNQLRPRHLHLIVAALQGLSRGTTFTVV
jgi:hypothetical protein